MGIMYKIRYVQNDEELEWFKGPDWIKVSIEVESFKKYSIVYWLEKHTKNAVIIYNGASRPDKSVIEWGDTLLGNKTKFSLFFENHDEALHFKMSYMKHE